MKSIFLGVFIINLLTTAAQHKVTASANPLDWQMYSYEGKGDSERMK